MPRKLKDRLEAKCWGVLVTRRTGQREILPYIEWHRGRAVDLARDMRSLATIKSARVVRMIAAPVVPL